MKKILIFVFVFFCSFCGFSFVDDYLTNGIGRVRIYRYTGPSVSSLDYVAPDCYDRNSLLIAFQNYPFGLRFDPEDFAIFSPSIDVSPNKTWGIDHQVSLYTNSNQFAYFSPRDISFVNDLYVLACNLYCSGYRGPGFSFSSVSGRVVYLNFDYRSAVSDILCSTNTVYRQLVLSHLSTISANVASIDSSVGSISTLVNSISSSLQPDPFQVDFVSAIRTLQSTSELGTIDYNGIIQEYNELPSSEARFLYARGFSRLFDSQKGAQGLLNGFQESPSQLSYIGRNFNGTVNAALTGSSSGVGSGGIAGDIKRLSTNDWASVVTNQLAQNTRDAKQQLKDNHDSITNQLAHMFDDNPNSVGRAIRSTANNTASTASDVAAIAGKLNSTLHVQIDNPNNIGVVLDGPVTIDTTQFNGVSVPLAGLKDKIDTWYNDWYSFWDISTPAYSWDNFYNMVRDFKDQNHSDVASITNLPFFSSVSNSLASIDKFLQTNSFSSSLHALLLDDYADYITNRFYSSAVDTFKDDYPSVYTNLVKFGLSTEDGEGNFWSLISSTLFYQSALVCGMLEDLATVRQFAEDHIEGGFSGGVTSLIDKMPSSTDLADRVNMASNEVLKIEAAADSFYTSYATMTNTAVSAFSPFRGIFSSVPENLVFFKTGNEQYITIPVSQGGNAWSVIRLCFSFSLVAVNVILFPKFVLMVIVLLSKLSKRFVKFVPTDR